MSASNTPVGFTSTIDCFGDSLTAGAGGNGQNVATCLAALNPMRIVNNQGIGGQTAAQIAARQGGLSASLNITGGSLPASFATAVVVPSIQLLSTPSDNTTRYISGVINGAQATISRTASGGPPSTAESYTIMGAGNPGAVTIPTWASFISDQGENARDSIQVLWLGRNNVGVDIATVPGIVAQCVAYMRDPKRYVVLGILPALTEIAGSPNGIAIAQQNAILLAAYGSQFVPSTPPSAAEMTAVGYSPTGQDNTDITNGVWPAGLRADAIHLTGPAYQVFALRVQAVISLNGW